MKAFRCYTARLKLCRMRARKPSMLLRVCLRYHLRREPGRWPGVYPMIPGKANSVSPIPARIALQGGERADSDAICPCPPQEESDLQDLYGRQNAPDLEKQPAKTPGKVSCTPLPLQGTAPSVLAEPFNNNKKAGQGQSICPAPGNFSRVTRRYATSTRHLRERNRPAAWCSAYCRDCERSPGGHWAHLAG